MFSSDCEQLYDLCKVKKTLKFLNLFCKSLNHLFNILFESLWFCQKRKLCNCEKPGQNKCCTCDPASVCFTVCLHLFCKKLYKLHSFIQTRIKHETGCAVAVVSGWNINQPTLSLNICIIIIQSCHSSFHRSLLFTWSRSFSPPNTHTHGASDSTTNS